MRPNNSLLQSLSKVELNDAIVVGAALFPGSVFDQACLIFAATFLELSTDYVSLALVMDMTLLRSSSSSLYLLRCSPSVSHSALDCFDSLL